MNPGKAGAKELAAHRAFVEGFNNPQNNCGENITFNPAVSEKQRRFMGAELARKRAGKKTRTGMSEKKLREFASKG